MTSGGRIAATYLAVGAGCALAACMLSLGFEELRYVSGTGSPLAPAG